MTALLVGAGRRIALDSASRTSNLGEPYLFTENQGDVFSNRRIAAA
jgi:hypothetical protein